MRVSHNQHFFKHSRIAGNLIKIGHVPSQCFWLLEAANYCQLILIFSTVCLIIFVKSHVTLACVIF